MDIVNDAVKEQLAGVQEDSPDVGRWELETEPLLDKIYHKLIGYSENERGAWERDPNITRVMNELGASEFVHEVRMRFNISMKTSVLSKEEIIKIVAEVGEDYADKLQDYYEVWEVNPSRSNLIAIANQLVHALFIFLMIAKDGGMRKHLEKRGIKTYYNPAQGGGY